MALDYWFQINLLDLQAENILEWKIISQSRMFSFKVFIILIFYSSSKRYHRYSIFIFFFKFLMITRDIMFFFSNSLPYRIVFAVLTEDSLILYDSQQSIPFGMISNIHYHQLSDVTWWEYTCQYWQSFILKNRISWLQTAYQQRTYGINAKK